MILLRAWAIGILLACAWYALEWAIGPEPMLEPRTIIEAGR